jgi:XRE family aerobic/anaerobic benzoate catabolism transcriptional regulator
MQRPRLLEGLGARVRAERLARGWSATELSRKSGLSPRFLHDLERGAGNISVERLAEVAQALGLSMVTLVSGLSAHEDDADRLAALKGTARQRALAAALPPATVALVGLRGAGKSTVGAALAGAMGCPFHELDARVEERAGVGLAELFEFGGPQRYRELERAVVAEVVGPGASPCVVATGGSLVTDPETWRYVRREARTVWLRAAPATHLARVEAQGDTRPMRGRQNALAELEAILSTRTPLYAHAEVHVDTDPASVDGIVRTILDRLGIPAR